MITFKSCEFVAHGPVDQPGDSSFGNRLFMIAGTIGIAVKNGYSYGFPEWQNSRVFVNPLPSIEPGEYNHVDIPWGFNGFDIPNNSSLYGYMQTNRYFSHCEDLIRHYFTLKPVCEPIKDTILIHYRAYHESICGNLFVCPTRNYFLRALKKLPDRKVVVITDNPQRAKEIIREDFEYMNNLAIVDFYLLSQADYVIMSPSTFSWWGAWLSKAQTVAPAEWYSKSSNVSSADINCKNWIIT